LKKGFLIADLFFFLIIIFSTIIVHFRIY